MVAVQSGRGTDIVKKWIGLAVLFLAMCAVIWLDFAAYFDFQALQAWRSSLKLRMGEAPITAAGMYFMAYVLVAAFSIPGATIMTLTGGALFGFWPGIILASFSSTLGACLAFLGTRYFLREMMRKRFAKPMRRIDEGIERDGLLYLFSLRLIPVLPFLVINIAMGLTQMTVLRFALVSQIGMLPVTVLYVNAGTQLADLQSPAGILSMPMLLSFAGLALLPWLARGAMGWVHRRKI